MLRRTLCVPGIGVTGRRASCGPFQRRALEREEIAVKQRHWITAMQFHETTLDNGLKVVVESNPSVHSVAAGFFVRTGARDETPEVSGVSHFLEHMAFKGTEEYTENQLY